MSDAVGWMCADLCAPVARTLFATDARGADNVDNGAYAAVASDVSQETVLSCAEVSVAPGFSMMREDQAFEGLRDPALPLARHKPVSMLPQEVFDKPAAEWLDLFTGLWRFADHISLGESRVVLLLAQLLTSDARASGHKVVSLQDNFVTASMYAKGRSGKLPLNFLARRKGAFCVAGNLTMMLPRVETYHQPADGSSRLALHLPSSGPRPEAAGQTPISGGR